MLSITNPEKFDWANMPLHDCAEGNAMDTFFTLKLFHLLKAKLEEQEDNLPKLIENVLNPALEIFADSEYRGIDVDPFELGKCDKQLRRKIMEIEDGMYELDGVKGEDNFNSVAHLVDILFTRDGGMELYPTEFTDTGTPTTNVDALKLLLSLIDEELERRG